MNDGVDGKSACGCVAAVSLMLSTSMFDVDNGINNKSGGGCVAALLLMSLMWCIDDGVNVDLGYI